jgi:hypothetical protein
MSKRRSSSRKKAPAAIRKGLGLPGKKVRLEIGAIKMHTKAHLDLIKKAVWVNRGKEKSIKALEQALKAMKGICPIMGIDLRFD